MEGEEEMEQKKPREPPKWKAYEEKVVFTQLGETALGHTDCYNVYGVVIDAI